jgi:acyl-CoA reductase-like NAD-dependent aldehyde dehydrogenase
VVAKLSSRDLEAVVKRVAARLEAQDVAAGRNEPSGRGLYAEVETAVAAAEQAFRVYGTLGLERRKAMIANLRRRCTEQVRALSEGAVAETGLGRVADKVQKNLLVIHKTPGPEVLEPVCYTGDDGLTLTEWAPYGVIAAVTPSTNPTETIICNAIGMLAAGNTVVFNAHPAAREVCARCVQTINDAIVEAGGPEDCAVMVEEPSIESAQALMSHPRIRLVVVTGGPAVVRAAMSSGKKVIAAGPGNPPAVVDVSADLDAAGRGIVLGASLDNNIVCVVEKEVLVLESVAKALIESMRAHGAVQLRGHQIRQLEQVILADGRPDKRWVGKDAKVLAESIGLRLEGDPRLLICEVPFEHPFVQEELLMPVLPIVRVPTVNEAIEKAVVAEHGFGHTAVMWSRNIDHLHAMARVINTSIYVKNAPSFAGLGMGGEGYTSFTIASPTGEGLTNARHFARARRCTLKDRFRIV